MWLTKTGLTQALASSTLVLPPAAAVATSAYRRRQLVTPDTMAYPGRCQPPRSVYEFIKIV